MANDGIVIFDRPERREHPQYAAWLPSLSKPVSFESPNSTNWLPDEDTALVISCDQYRSPYPEILQRLVEEGDVGVLIVADGILEYRNTWMNPGHYPGAIFQPVRGHKLACIGRSQARIVEAWGNAGKCEIVGSPRLDILRERLPRKRSEQEPFRILVLTAKQPWFTPEQKTSVMSSLADLKNWFEAHATLKGMTIEPYWRIAKEAAAELDIENRFGDDTGRELAGVLKEVDAVVTTPSTTMLEGMLQGLPVAVLDYTNVPVYVPAAWHMGGPEHLNTILPELLDPPRPKILFQEQVLQDALECQSPAYPRMVKLVEAMCEAIQQSKGALNFPERIVPIDQGAGATKRGFEFQALYEGHPGFQEFDAKRLRAERDGWEKKYRRLAHTFPVNALVWVRRLFGAEDSGG